MRIMLKYSLDLFFFTRPILSMFVIFLFLIGANKADITISAVIAVGLISASSFIINQIFDIETDAYNNKLFFVKENIHSRNFAIIWSSLFVIIAILMAYTINIIFFILIIILTIISIFFYSIPPISLKDKPWGGIITHFISGFILCSLGYSLSETPWHFEIITKALGVGFLLSVEFLFAMYLDIKGDLQSGKITYIVAYGEDKTLTLCRYLLLLASLCFCYSDVFLAIISITVFFLTLIKQFNSLILLRNISSLALLSYIFSRYWEAIAIFIVLVFTSKIYYKKRFNIRYPF